jgi:hypothetical protein
MPMRILTVGTACLFLSGCFLGTPVAKRGVEIRQDKHTGTVGEFEINYSAMPAGAVEVRKDTSDRHGTIQSLEIAGQYPAKILIVPATQPMR